MVSLYIHVPFCVSKCHYCGFFSSPYDAVKADAYIEALGSESALMANRFSGTCVSTVYVGGGTPSVLSARQLGRLLDLVAGPFLTAPDVEWTIEANPGVMAPDLLDAARRGGVNRVSIGVQSFSADILAALGRPHTPADCGTAVSRARDAGFRNISLDLIYGIPGQSGDSWRETVEGAIALGPEHIALYCLSLDPGSRYHQQAGNGALALPEDGVAAAMYEDASGLLENAGFECYELSNFARKGFACRHNLQYWRRGDYLGLGPGAWSFLGGIRSSSVPDIDEYARRLRAGLPVLQTGERISAAQAAQEQVLLGLRLSEGIDLAGFRVSHGEEAYDRLAAAVKVHEGRGLIELTAGRLRLTRAGRLLADEVILRL